MTSATKTRPKGSNKKKVPPPAHPKATNPVRRTINKKPTARRFVPFDPRQDIDPKELELLSRLRDYHSANAAGAEYLRLRGAPPPSHPPPPPPVAAPVAAQGAQGGRNRKARNGRTRRNKSNKGSRRGRMRSPRSFKSLFHF